MAADNDKTTWHLTPRGWEAGSYYEFRRLVEDVPNPPDRVMTGTYHVYQQTMNSEQERTWEIEWTATDVDLVKRLIAKFGERPKNCRL